MTERQLQNIGAKYGTKKPLSDSDIIDNRDLTQHAFISVVEQQGTRKRYYHVGSGVENADTNVGRFSMDLQVADDDGGTNQADAEGTARFAVYPDDPADSSPKATGDEFTLAELRSLDGLNHREKALLPVQKPGAAQDEYVVLEVQIDSSQEGKQVYQEGSSLTGSLSMVRVGR
jgi:hypothetical protein